MENDFTVWAFNEPNGAAKKFVFDTLNKGFSRFGWSYIDNADLNYLNDKSWDDMNEDEEECFRKGRFLLNIKPNDWIVHINVPTWGECTAIKVDGYYEWDKEQNKFGLHEGTGKAYSETGDYRHLIKVNPETKIVFDRKDENIIPSVKLGGQGKYWRIYNKEDFIESLDNIRENKVNLLQGESVGLFHLKTYLSPLLKEITFKIHQSHPRATLEGLIANVFRKIPNVIEVNEHGKNKGFGTDHGADLIVTYKSGLSISNLEKQEILIVQVKSFIDEHWDTEAVEQIEIGIEEFEADAGLIITTAESTKKLEEEIELLSKKLEKPIGLIAGEDTAKFVLKYGGSFIL